MVYSTLAEWPEPCEQLVRLAAADPGLSEALGGGGESITRPPLWSLWSGSVSANDVRVALPIQGKVRRGTLHGAATRVNGAWTILVAEVWVHPAPGEARPMPGGPNDPLGDDTRGRVLDEGVVAVYDLLGGRKGTGTKGSAVVSSPGRLLDPKADFDTEESLAPKAGAAPVRPKMV
jgi:hypothetical protein